MTLIRPTPDTIIGPSWDGTGSEYEYDFTRIAQEKNPQDIFHFLPTEPDPIARGPRIIVQYWLLRSKPPHDSRVLMLRYDPMSGKKRSDDRNTECGFPIPLSLIDGTIRAIQFALLKATAARRTGESISLDPKFVSQGPHGSLRLKIRLDPEGNLVSSVEVRTVQGWAPLPMKLFTIAEIRIPATLIPTLHTLLRQFAEQHRDEVIRSVETVQSGRSSWER